MLIFIVFLASRRLTQGLAVEGIDVGMPLQSLTGEVQEQDAVIGELPEESEVVELTNLQQIEKIAEEETGSGCSLGNINAY